MWIEGELRFPSKPHREPLAERLERDAGAVFEHADAGARGSIDHPHDETVPFDRRFDAHHARAVVGPDAMFDRVLDERLQEQRGDLRLGCARVHVGLHHEPRVSEARAFDREVRARVIDLALERRVLRVVQQVAVEIGEIVHELAGFGRVDADRGAEGVECVEQEVRFQSAAERLEREMIRRRLGADGVQIFIGNESGVTVLDECSVVTAPYRVDGEVAGVLGVIGPTRMAYQRIVPLVDLTARMFGVGLKS